MINLSHQKNNKLIYIIILSFSIYLVSAIFITYPLIFNLTNLVGAYGDELIITWIQNFVIHNSLTFNANIYYPFQNTLAYSDLFLSSSLLSAIPVHVFKEPIVAFNFTLIASLALLGFSVFSLSYYLTKNFLVSIIGGLLVTFSPAVHDKFVHLQILAIYFIPFSMLFFLHFIKTKRSLFLGISLFFFVLQTLNSFLPGYFIIFFYITTSIILLLWDRQELKSLITKKNLLLILISFLILIPSIIPYIQVSREFNYKRDIRDAIHFAIQPEDLLVTNSYSRLEQPLSKIFENKDYPDNASIKFGFIGLVFTILALIFVFYFLKTFKKKNIELNSLFFTGILGLITSLGPALHINRLTIHEPFPIILPYALFYFVLPGFSGFRNSARWEMLFILSFAVGISIMLSYFYKKLSKEKIVLVSIILIIGIIGEYNFPMQFKTIPKTKEFPRAYSFLEDKMESAVFIPLCNWNDECAPEEFFRIYYSTKGFPRIANGVSGFSPPPWEKWVAEINKEFPNNRSLQSIKEKGIKYIIFEKDIYNKYFGKNTDEVLNLLLKHPQLQEVEQFDNTYVFELL